MFADKIKILLIKRKLGITDLANMLECTPSNITNKLKRDNFSEKELLEIADKLNCEFIGSFKMKDTNEII